MVRLRLRDTQVSGRWFSWKGDVLRIYACGITPSWHLHVGHLRYMFSLYVFCKVMAEMDLQVISVINWTDVFDQDSNKLKGVDWGELSTKGTSLVNRSARELERFFPLHFTHMPRVSDYLARIKSLSFANLDFRTSPIGVFWQRKPYFQLGRWVTRENFALWKNKGVSGIPGWHIECAVMIKDIIGRADIHFGGRDLIFPHHVNEACCYQTLFGGRVSRYWCHLGLALSEKGEKMSKSHQTGVFLKDIQDQHRVECLLYLLSKAPFENFNFKLRGVDEFFRWLQGRIECDLAIISLNTLPSWKPSREISYCFRSGKWNSYFKRIKEVKVLFQDLLFLDLIPYTYWRRWLKKVKRWIRIHGRVRRADPHQSVRCRDKLTDLGIKVSEFTHHNSYFLQIIQTLRILSNVDKIFNVEKFEI